MSEDNDTMRLHTKYMALAHSSSENDRQSAHEFARQILTSPIRNAQDLNTKLKILETEIAHVRGIDAETRYRLLELLALTAQADLQTDNFSDRALPKTRH